MSLLLLLSVVAQPVKKNVPASVATSARRVKLIREKSRVDFMVVIFFIFVVVLLPLRLRHCFGAAESHNCPLLCLGASLLHGVNTPSLAEPLHVF